jgi:hypothetical protein
VTENIMMALTYLSVLLLVPHSLSLSLMDGDQAGLDLEDELQWTLDQLPHHREKRFLFFTDEKRIVMPPGSQLVLTPTLAMPFIRHPPDGLDANMTISTPFTISFDAMGVTDNQNPFGLIPFLNPLLGRYFIVTYISLESCLSSFIRFPPLKRRSTIALQIFYI